MDLIEASKFYGDYRQLLEDCRAELSENFEDAIPSVKILTCDDCPKDL